MVGGLAAVVALGVLMAAICLQTRQESWSYPEAVAGALFLLVGRGLPAVRAARCRSRASACSCR